MAAVNMTEGSITKHLVDYSIPLILGNMFQLTYNAVDSIIAGTFIGKEALAAEGTASPVMNIVILGISGICMGASVLMSEFYGAGQKEKLKREMSTTVIFGCYFSVIIAILGGFFSKSLLGALGVPDEILGKAASYLSVIFLGAPFTYFYNAVSAALKSVGDSKTPLKFFFYIKRGFGSDFYWGAGIWHCMLCCYHGSGGGGLSCSLHNICIQKNSYAAVETGRVHHGQAASQADTALRQHYSLAAILPAHRKAVDSGCCQSAGRGYDCGLQRGQSY